MILVDIDNTLYDWPSFFAPSFRAMLHALSRELELPEDQLYGEFKAVFAHRKSLEYAFAIQELDSVRRLDNERIRHLVRQGRGAFLSVQRVRLCPYPTVLDTLQWLVEQGYEIVGVTNAPIFLAQKRLWDLKLDSYLTGVVAWEGFAPEADPANTGFVPQSRERRQTRLKRTISVPLTDCKPSEKHYSIALDAFAGAAKEVWAIGDSLAKDLEPAAKLGIKTVWARYGSDFDPDNVDESTLLRITHWSPGEIHRTFRKDSFKPDRIIDTFAQLKEIVPATIIPLF
ncbi:MAG: HAD family hydrolase [Casimicrobiaceae bacterium]